MKSTKAYLFLLLFSNYMIDQKSFPNTAQAIYVVILGTEVTYILTGNGNSFVMGASSFCGTHGVVSWGSANGASYSAVGMLKSVDSTCNVAKALGGVFPNDYSVDNVAAILVHEMVD